jgi:hypothetical protein
MAYRHKIPHFRIQSTINYCHYSKYFSWRPSRILICTQKNIFNERYSVYDFGSSTTIRFENLILQLFSDVSYWNLLRQMSHK